MPEEIRVWKIEGHSSLREVRRSKLDLEERLEHWLANDISLLDPNLLVIGRQVPTAFGGFIDLLCLNRDGDVVVVELKRDKTPRETTAQALDYGSWVEGLTNEELTNCALGYLKGQTLEEAFNDRFGEPLPETLNDSHRLLVVASQIDASSERIIKYLSEIHGVNINAATFQYFKEESGAEIVARAFLLEPEEAAPPGGKKRRAKLSYEQLEAKADENGVGDLYRSAVAGLERSLQKHTKATSIGFTGNFDGSRKTVVSLIPAESNGDDGLRFQVYGSRIKTLLHLSDEDCAPMLPSRREPWIYYQDAGPDYEGFQGFFANREEVDRFVAVVEQGQPHEGSE